MADEPIRASLNVVLDDVTVRRPAPPDTYLGVANAMMPGVEQLAAAMLSSRACAGRKPRTGMHPESLSFMQW